MADVRLLFDANSHSFKSYRDIIYEPLPEERFCPSRRRRKKRLISSATLESLGFTLDATYTQVSVALSRSDVLGCRIDRAETKFFGVDGKLCVPSSHVDKEEKGRKEIGTPKHPCHPSND